MIPNGIVSLCTGIGGLEMAVSEVYGGEVRAFADIDPSSATVFGAHNSGVPNLGDISKIDWRGSGAVDIVTAGFPCQDISDAGLRKGLEGDRSGIYIHVVRAVRELRPRLVVIENVSAILRRGGATVVQHLAEAGYDAQWITVRASDAIGACHPRARWFCVARLRDAPRVEFERPWGSDFQAQSEQIGDSDRASEDADRESRLERGRAAPGEASGRGPRPDAGRRSRVPDSGAALSLLPTPLASEGAHGGPNARHSDGSWKLSAIGNLIPDPAVWGDYTAAVHRWSSLFGHEPPNPHAVGPRGGVRVSAPFVEWMMGFQPGYVTAVPGLSYNDQMARLGNAVMPQHAAAALRLMDA